MASTIFVTDYEFPDLSIERSVLEGSDVELASGQAKTPEAVINATADIDVSGLLVQYGSINASVFEALDELQVVGRYGIGVDSVDITAATEHGVQVVNVPDYCVDEVPTHTLALLLNCARNITRYDHEVKDGTWDWTTGKPIGQVAGSTLGLVGFGKLPHRLLELVEGFGFEVLVYDPYIDTEAIESAGCEEVTFNELLKRARFVSLHAPLTEDTEGMIDAAAFETMREDSILVNTARGGLVNTSALEDAIENERIAGAGIDVLPQEPPDPTPPFDHPNVIYTPHVAWYSENSMIEMRQTVTEDALNVIRGKSAMNPVNSL